VIAGRPLKWWVNGLQLAYVYYVWIPLTLWMMASPWIVGAAGGAAVLWWWIWLQGPWSGFWQ
jgi:hypothetical protein